ncbi:hypothetical protein [Loktanella sp. 5RATIMAR09]|nr:hypothetical protein [Loktanella sp. 5RATIMAR09]
MKPGAQARFASLINPLTTRGEYRIDGHDMFAGRSYNDNLIWA